MRAINKFVIRFADRITPLECRRNQHEILRSRVFVLVVLSLLACIASIYLWIGALIPMSPAGAQLTGRVLLGIGASGVVCLLAFKFFKSRMLAANLYGVMLWGMLLYAAVFTGGINTPSLALFILLPVLLGVTGGTRAGMYWMIIVCATWLTLLLLDRSGYQFVQVIQPQNYNTALTLCLSLACLVVVIVVVQYELMNHVLRIGLARERESLEHLASHDQLTALPNRRSFIYQWDLSLARASRNNTRVAILFLDLDKFKAVNDNMGHSAGDQLLQEVASRLQKLLRSTDFVARWGGDEFAMIVENVGGIEDLERVASKLVATIHQPVVLDGQQVSVGVSIGGAVFPDQSRDGQELERMADRAMYNAKQSPTGFVLCAG